MQIRNFKYEGSIMKTIYTENIVAAIKQCGCIEWYILDNCYRMEEIHSSERDKYDRHK